MKVINFFGSSGCGKSSHAHALTAHMKRKGIEVEFVNEFAKEVVWAKDFRRLKNQALVSGMQLDRIDMLDGQVEYAIVDSPILLGIIYNKLNLTHIPPLMIELFKRYENINFFIERNVPFVSNGRMEDEQENIDIDKQISSWRTSDWFEDQVAYDIQTTTDTEEIYEYIVVEEQNVKKNNATKKWISF